MRRQFLAAAFATVIDPSRIQLPTMTQHIATIREVPPVKAIYATDKLPLSQGLFTGSVTVSQLFASAPVAATGSQYARGLGDRLADSVNAKDHGAMLDGQTDDSMAIREAQVAAVGNLVHLPTGTAAIKALPDAITGRFGGEGNLLTGDGLHRARMFARRATAPTSYGALGDISTAFDGDMSTVQIAIEHRIDGNATLTKPTSGYAFHHENSAVSIYYQNKSGSNALSGDQGGRTGCAAISGRVAQEGQGDATFATLTGTVFGTNPGSTHFLANPAVLFLDGDLFAFADGTYQQVDEFSHNDFGFDVAVSSTVRNFYRTNNKGAKGAWWVGQRYQSAGSLAIDTAYQMVGKFNNILDTCKVATGPSAAVMTLAAGQRIYLAASNVDNFSNPAATIPGDSWLTFNPATKKVELAVRGAAVIQASSGGIEGNFLTPLDTIHIDSGPIAVTNRLVVINALTAVTMTLGAGQEDGHDMIIKRIGPGAMTLDLTLDGDGRARLTFDSEASKEAARIIWSVKLGSWLLIHRTTPPNPQVFT